LKKLKRNMEKRGYRILAIGIKEIEENRRTRKGYNIPRIIIYKG